jgi:hypothetical protein
MEVIIGLGFCLVVGAALSLALRGVALWFWRVNRIVALLEAIDAKLPEKGQ